MLTSLLRLAPLSLSLSVVACTTDGSGSAEPISSQEAAMTNQAVEGAVVAMAPVTSNNLATIAAAYRASFTTGGVSCATVVTDDSTFVTVTFACSGALATTGSVDLRLASPTTLEATADLTIGGISLEGSLELTVPLAPSEERSFEGQLTITGTKRTLALDAAASWTRDNECVTYSATGNVVAEGPRGSASATVDIDAKTVCGV